MNVFKIPLVNRAQTFPIVLSNVEYRFRIVWRDPQGWVLDILDSLSSPILCGMPLIPGVNLLRQFDYLGIGGALVVLTDGAALIYPTYTGLGQESLMYYVTE